MYGHHPTFFLVFSCQDFTKLFYILINTYYTCNILCYYGELNQSERSACAALRRAGKTQSPLLKVVFFSSLPFSRGNFLSDIQQHDYPILLYKSEHIFFVMIQADLGVLPASTKLGQNQAKYKRNGHYFVLTITLF